MTRLGAIGVEASLSLLRSGRKRKAQRGTLSSTLGFMLPPATQAGWMLRST